ncbi:PD-(D/E)XK nuclease family protein [uncultured Porphyromonas sp.]|uniref:PDDEXK-like family protein n=1 Tax=uncultured Porphyromonas sp. TaxID=159274 RepID=UPI00260E697C|nr:PD-(D/E)XK nuclease family protein [uncultured Porphyromonas sp.]
MKQLKQMLYDVGVVYHKAKALQEKQHANGELFNVFNVIGLRTEEVRLHSAFIAELLNPNGSHGMGSAFLQEFLGIVGLEADYVVSANEEIVERSIGTTTTTTGGRIDIILEDGNHALIIENKIYAGDQFHQLLRYYNYAKSHFPCGFKIVYLTLDGREPSSDSLGSEGYGVEYTPLSYQEEIRQWLRKCAQLAYNKPLVRESISQYLALLNQLTNNEMDVEFKKEIVALATDNIEAVSALMSSQSEISSRLCEDYIFKPLRTFTLNGQLLPPKVFTEERSPLILFRKPSWRHNIVITHDLKRPQWDSLYIGVSACIGDEGRHDPTLEIAERLSCLSLQSNVPWPYGSEWLPFGDWNEASSFVSIKTGEVLRWIMDRVGSIVTEIEERQLPM